jgi:hypothetical protein
MMNRRIPSIARLLALVVSVLPVAVSAQQTSGIEEERMAALAARNERQWQGPRNKVTVAFRILDTGGTVNFNNLGSIPAGIVPPISAGNVDRVYDNGTVHSDGLRSDEVNASGGQTSTPGGRYATYTTINDGTKLQTGDYVSYTPGQTREWQAYHQSQFDAMAGYVGFTNYSTTSEGGSIMDESGPAGGVEVQFERNFGRIGRRVTWGFIGALTLNSINSKAAGSIAATLNTHTDFYKIRDGYVAPAAPYGGPSFNALTDSDGNVVNPIGYETTVPISQIPDATKTSETSVAGGATVNGRWQVKGAYFMVKLGPSFHAQFNDQFGMSGSIGFAGGYAGTQFSVAESFTVPEIGVGQEPGGGGIDASTATEFLTGYYADLTFEWAANQSTGLFGGITAQQLSAYDQKVADRVARVDLGTAIGIRGGVSIRF